MNSYLAYLSKTIFFFLIAVPCVFASPKNSVFIEGNQWWLNYNGTPVLMKVIKKTKNSEKGQSYTLTIQDKRGILLSKYDRKSGIEHIRLMFKTNGRRTLCQGSVINGSKKSIIAGTCDKNMGLGSFYAEPKETLATTENNSECSVNLKRAQSAYKKTLKELWAEQANCTNNSRTNLTLQSTSPFSGYPTKKSNNPKADNVMMNIFPERPTNASLENKWFIAHNTELLRVVMTSLNKAEQSRYLKWEKTMCTKTSPYCVATARQKVIACAQGVGCK